MSRITPGTMTVVVFALLTGLAGAYVVRHHLASAPPVQPTAATPRPDFVVVPVALTDLEEGRVVTFNDIGVLRKPREEYLKSEYAKQTHLTAAEQIQGRTLKTALKKGDVFNPDNLYAFGDGPGLVDRLEVGYRAVTVPIRDIGAVQGFARPGSYVDVLFRSEPRGRRAETTFTLFERVQVLAINANVVKDQRIDLSQQGTVTLAVTPTQAKHLKVVEGRGELSLALRREDDEFQFVPFDPTLERSLSGLASPDATVMAAAFPSRATSRADAKTADAEKERIDRVISNAAERLTMDDLLGIPAEPTQSRMEIYYGREKEILTFEDPADVSLEVLRRGSGIRTPIVDVPPRPSPLLGTAQAPTSKRP